MSHTTCPHVCAPDVCECVESVEGEHLSWNGIEIATLACTCIQTVTLDAHALSFLFPGDAGTDAGGGGAVWQVGDVTCDV